jgi:AcrR family transcriptional regulator
MQLTTESILKEVMNLSAENAPFSLVDSETYAHFCKLDEQKRERVLSAAYDEFLSKDYGEASTNSITQKAEISKGLLFHYFGSKEGLYAFLMADAARQIANEAMAAIPTKPGDIFASIKEIIQVKIGVCLRYPRETDFLLSMWKTNLPPALVQKRENMAGLSSGYFDVITSLLSPELLRDDIEPRFAAEMISWVCEKYSNKVLAGGSMSTSQESWEQISTDLDAYFAALRRGLYKEIEG